MIIRDHSLDASVCTIFKLKDIYNEHSNEY